MIETNVPETGAQPRDLVVEVVSDTFEHAMRLADAGHRPPQLDPSIERARGAQRGDDLAALDRELRNISVAALATRVRIRAAMEEAIEREERPS